MPRALLKLPAKDYYSISETARLLGVHRQTLRYWLKKGWVRARRDYKNYPVFTPEDIRKIVKWRKTLRKA